MLNIMQIDKHFSRNFLNYIQVCPDRCHTQKYYVTVLGCFIVWGWIYFYSKGKIKYFKLPCLFSIIIYNQVFGTLRAPIARPILYKFLSVSSQPSPIQPIRAQHNSPFYHNLADKTQEHHTPAFNSLANHNPANHIQAYHSSNHHSIAQHITAKRLIVQQITSQSSPSSPDYQTIIAAGLSDNPLEPDHYYAPLAYIVPGMQNLKYEIK